MKTQLLSPISLQLPMSPRAPSHPGASIPRCASVSPLGDSMFPALRLSSCSGFARTLREGGAWFAHAGALGLPEGPGSLSARRLTQGEQKGQQSASTVCHVPVTRADFMDPVEEFASQPAKQHMVF